MTPKHRDPSPMNEKLIFPTLGHKLDNTYYGQSHSSPYKLPLVSISIGEDRYGIPWSYLEKHQKLDRLIYSGSLEISVSPDIGHTIMHFLYTGQWQTIDTGVCRNKTFMEREFQRGVQVYHASIKYDLHELKAMAEQYIAHFGKEYTAIEVLRLTSEVFSEFPEDEFWLPKYVTDALQEMARGVKSKLNIRDNSAVSRPGCLAIMAAVIEVQYSRILELESTRGTYQTRPGVQMHGCGVGYYPDSRHPMHPMYPMPARPTSPGSAVDSASPGGGRYHRPASPSSAEYTGSAGTRSIVGGLPRTPDEDTADETLVRPAEHSAEDPADASDKFPDCDPDEGSEDPSPIKDCLSAAAIDDGSPVEVHSFEESVVEAVKISVYEESTAEDCVAEETFTEEPVSEELVEVIIYEESILDEPITEEPAWEEPAVEEPAVEKPVPEEPVPEEPVAEPITTETDLIHPLLPNSNLYKDWKTLGPKKRRLRAKKLKHKGLPIPDQDGVISITLA